MASKIDQQRVTECSECGAANNKQREDCRKCGATLLANIPSVGEVVQVRHEGRTVEVVVVDTFREYGSTSFDSVVISTGKRVWVEGVK